MSSVRATTSTWCLPAEAPSTEVISLSRRQPQGEGVGRAKLYLRRISWSRLREMSTRVAQSHWNHRAVGHIYQIGPRLIWQKQHVLLLHKPTGVNTIEQPMNSSWDLFILHVTEEEIFLTILLWSTERKNLTIEITWHRKKRKQLLGTRNIPLKKISDCKYFQWPSIRILCMELYFVPFLKSVSLTHFSLRRCSSRTILSNNKMTGIIKPHAG